MLINEYIVVRDNYGHPKLKLKNEIKWNKDFLKDDNIVDFLNENFYMNILSEEYAYVISFDCQMNPLGVFQLSHGNWFSVKIEMRELGIFLLLTGAETFVVAHNHPNGFCKPSQNDFKITNKLRELSDLIAIDVRQHYVIGKKDWDSIIYNEEDEDNEYDEYINDNDNVEDLPFGMQL